MNKENYKKPEVKSDTVEIGTYGGYALAPVCAAASSEICNPTAGCSDKTF